MSEFYYSSEQKNVSNNLTQKLWEMLRGEIPIIVCIGTDATIGDSLGPICGTMLEGRMKEEFIYGTLQKTVTAKEIKTIKTFIAKVHPFSKVLVIDAAVGNATDIGYIKISDAPIKPGLGANKDLPEIGDISIISIIGEKSHGNYAFMNMTRLSPVYHIAKLIADAIENYYREAKSAGIKSFSAIS